jgi:RNA polymerase sigma-70 factor, ECF subfamily
VRTLGDLLYADPARVQVAESEWVALVRGMAAGEALALHALYERTHRLVFTLALRITRDREAAEELTVDTFYDVWRRASAYDPEGGTVLGWIMNQARSRAIDRVRYENRQKRSRPATADVVTEPAGDDLEEACKLTQQAALLRDALGVLTADERRAIESAFFAELSHAEVAARLNEPLGTIKTRIRSGLAKLRQVLGVPAKSS